MDLPRNILKHAILENRLQVGLFCNLPSNYTAELLATCGFDWLLFDTEHTPGDPLTVFAQVQALAAYPTQTIVRPVSHDPALIKQYLDAGVQTLLIPMVQSAEEAERASLAMRYAPEGIRGFAGLTRATRFGSVEDYARRAAEELCLVVQVESRAGLEQIEAIAAVDGVDAVFLGPSDLAASLGHPGQPNHAEVRAAIEDALARIQANGKAAGILTLDHEFARHCIELGAVLVGVDVDAAILLREAKALAKAFGAMGING